MIQYLQPTKLTIHLTSVQPKLLFLKTQLEDFKLYPYLINSKFNFQIHKPPILILSSNSFKTLYHKLDRQALCYMTRKLFRLTSIQQTEIPGSHKLGKQNTNEN